MQITKRRLTRASDLWLFYNIIANDLISFRISNSVRFSFHFNSDFSIHIHDTPSQKWWCGKFQTIFFFSFQKFSWFMISLSFVIFRFTCQSLATNPYYYYCWFHYEAHFGYTARQFQMVFFSFCLVVVLAACPLSACGGTVYTRLRGSSFVFHFSHGSCSITSSSIRRCGFIHRPMCRHVSIRIWPPNFWATHKSIAMCDASVPCCRQCIHSNSTIGWLIREPRVALHQKV